MREQRLDLGPGAIHVEMTEAERGEARVPVPLEGIEALGRHRIGAAIVLAQDGRRLAHQVGPLEDDVHAAALVSRSNQRMRSGLGTRLSSSPGLIAASESSTARNNAPPTSVVTSVCAPSGSTTRTIALRPPGAMVTSSGRMANSSFWAAEFGPCRLRPATVQRPSPPRVAGRKFIGGLPMKLPTKRAAGLR